MAHEPTEMELRVAKGICCGGQCSAERGYIKECQSGYFYSEARAAIRAMREPTAEMLEAFSRTGRSYDDDGPDMPEGWQAMIDVASPPK